MDKQSEEYEASGPGASVQIDFATKVAHEFPDRQHLPLLTGRCAGKSVDQTQRRHQGFKRFRGVPYAA